MSACSFSLSRRGGGWSKGFKGELELKGRSNKGIQECLPKIDFAAAILCRNILSEVMFNL